MFGLNVESVTFLSFRFIVVHSAHAHVPVPAAWRRQDVLEADSQRISLIFR